VQATGGIFFDVSNENFTLSTPAGPTFFLQGPGCGAAALSLCGGAAGTQTLTVGQRQNFTGTVALSAAALPAGFSVAYTTSTVAAGTSTTVTISAAATVAAGSYTIRLTGTSGGVTRVLEVPVTVLPTATQAVTLTAPAAGSVTTLRPRVTWTATPNATAYEVQIASDAAFTTIIQTQTNLTGTSYTPAAALQPGTAYYVRVRALSPCATAPYSAAVAFTTGTEVCQSAAATSVPVAIPSAAANTVASVINVTNSDPVSAIRIRNLTIVHANIGELEIALTNPAGRRVVLFANACPGTADLNLTFDEAAASAINCPLTSGATVRPATSLGELLNDPATGTWTLSIRDNAAGNGGTLTGWTLELCTLGALPSVPTDLTTFPATVSPAGADISMLWLDNSGNESGFELERAANGNPAFTRIAILPANTTFYSDRVTANGTYCYRVRAVNATGNSAYSNESCQTVAGITPVRNAAAQGLSVFPNPGTGVFNLKLDNAQRGSVTVRVTDAVGRRIFTQTLTKSTDLLQFPLDLRNLSTGVYTLHLDLPTGSTAVRLLKE
jgi:subtilisin-like proprotein convertase family protein